MQERGWRRSGWERPSTLDSSIAPGCAVCAGIRISPHLGIGVRGTLAVAHTDKFLNWVLPGVERELNGPHPAKRYPFAPDTLVPWWSQFSDRGEGDEGDYASSA